MEVIELRLDIINLRSLKSRTLNWDSTEYCHSTAVYTYVEIKSHILSFAVFPHHITHMATVSNWNTGSVAIPWKEITRFISHVCTCFISSSIQHN